MKLLSRKMIATVLVLTMVLSTPGMSIFANSIDDLIATESAKVEAIDNEFEEEKLLEEKKEEIEEEKQEDASEVLIEEEDVSEDETEAEVETETETETEVETEAEENEETTEITEEQTESQSEETTVSEEVVEETTTAEEVVATASEVEGVVEVIGDVEFEIATVSEMADLKISTVSADHDESWRELNQSNLMDLTYEKYTKFYLTEDVILFKYHYDVENTERKVTICLHGHEVDFDSQVNLYDLEKCIEFVDHDIINTVIEHDDTWEAAGQDKFIDSENTYSMIPNGKFYLTEDITLSGKYVDSATNLNPLMICLHGHKITIDETFSLGSVLSLKSFSNCSNEKPDIENVENINKIPDNYVHSNFQFENVNIVSNKKLVIQNPTVFDNCTFNITTSDEVAVEVTPDIDVEFKNFDYNNRNAGFLIDGAKVTFENVNMKNNTVNTLFTVQNQAEVNVKGTGIYDGNRNIYELRDSKLNVIDGSGNAKDTLRQPASAEYYEPVVTEKGTKLLNPDAFGLNIVYKRNVGQYIIRSFNSETIFDGVIVANQFQGADTSIGSWIAAGEEKSKLTLINRAYVNQNRRNILVNHNSDIYGSITYKDGTFDTLDRDATLSFYPIEPGMTILKNVIKKNENSLLLTPRNLKGDDEWTTEIGDYIYKACMIDGYTNDLFEYKNTPEDHPARTNWVICDKVVRDDGLEEGTFRLGEKDYKIVTLRLHLGEGVLKDTTFSPNETNAKYPYEDIGDTFEVYWRPFYKANGYPTQFKDEFNAIKLQWIDESVENEPYEYEHTGWSTSPEWLISPTGKSSPGYLEEGIREITDNKWERYHYHDVVDLYACWKGKLKQKLVFTIQEEKKSDTYPIPIDYFEQKEIFARVDHPMNLPVYESPVDFVYDGFELTGWREIDKKALQQTNGYTVVHQSELMEMGSEYTPAHHEDFYDGEEVFFWPEFRGEPHKISWYLQSEGITYVHPTLPLNAEGFYERPGEIRLGEPYSIIGPKLDSSIIAYEIVNFEIEDDLEFLGWTKQEIKEPIASASQLEDIVLVRDYTKGFASREDVKYYPVLYKTGLIVEHDGYMVLTEGKLNAEGALPAGVYHLNNDTEVAGIKELEGDVVIDLHGRNLKFKPGAFFYSQHDLKFTDCKYDEGTDRGRIDNQNGAIYHGSGSLSFEKVALTGRQAYTFQDLEKEVIMDDVDILQAQWVGMLHNLDKEDLYPRNMQIENTTVHIKNSTIQKTTGMFYVMDGGHLTMTNVKVLNNGGPKAEWTDGGIFRVLNRSKMTINSPAWFEGNKDIFLVDNSSLEINSKADHYDGDLEAIKDDAVIFTSNGTQTLGYLNHADVKLSGIFVDNKVRAGIFYGYDQGDVTTKTNPTRLHYDGYVYVRGNSDNSGFGGDIFVNGNNIWYYQNDSDRINTNSVLDIYTYWANPLYFTNCEPDSCRSCYIIGNLSDEEKEAFDNNRDADGNIRNFTLMNYNNGYQQGGFYPIIDGIHYDNEKNRGWDIVYNPRREQDVIDINFKMYYNTSGRFKDMDGNIVKETTVQLDKRNPEKFKEWYDKLTENYIPYDSFGYPLNRELGPAFRKTSFPLTPTDIHFTESKFDIYKSADYIYIFLTEKRSEEELNRPQYISDTYDVHYYVNSYDLYKYKGAYHSVKVDGNSSISGLTKNDTHIIQDIVVNQTYTEVIGGDYDRYTDMFPYTLKGWKLTTADGEVLLKPGTPVNFRQDYAAQNYYNLEAVFEPRPMEIKFMTNDYVRYKKSEHGDYSIIATIGETIKIPKIFDLDIDPDMTFFGWVTEEEHVHFTINEDGEQIKLPQDMYISKFAQELVTMRLKSTYKIEKYLREFKIYPVYFPKNETVLRNILDSQKRKEIVLLARLNFIENLKIQEEEKQNVTININADGGTFKDPSGSNVSSYSLKFKKNNADVNLVNWAKSFVAEKKDTRDNYIAKTKKFVDEDQNEYTAEELLSVTSSISVKAVYEFPELYKAVFRAEKGGSSSLKGKAYNTFNPITKYVRLTESGNTKGKLTAPAASVISIIPDYTTDYVWRAENSAYSNVNAGAVLTVGSMNIPSDTMYFYLSYSEAPKSNTSGGGNGGGGGGGGGGIASLPNNDANAPQTPQLEAQPGQAQSSEPAAVPSNSNPFGIEVVTNAFGVAQQLSAAETGMVQMAKASAAMQQAIANPNAPATKVSETSVKASEANWTKGADGLWSLSTTNAEPIKDTWQKVEVAAGVEGWYKFDANGKMQTGWVADGNKVFFLIESGTNQGQMVRNTTVNIGGFEFKFAADGSLETMGAKA